MAQISDLERANKKKDARMLSEKRKVMNITTEPYLRIMKILNKRLSENRFF